MSEGWTEHEVCSREETKVMCINAKLGPFKSMGSLHAKIYFYGFPRTVATTTFFSFYSLFLDVDEKQLISVFFKDKISFGNGEENVFLLRVRFN